MPAALNYIKTIVKEIVMLTGSVNIKINLSHQLKIIHDKLINDKFIEI
jgi:hypothetical protein